MIRLGLCLEPHDEACRGIAEKALRSIDPNAAKNNKDRIARLAKRRQILSQTMEGSTIPNESIYPNFESRYPIPESERMAVTISKESTDKLAEKIARGLLYLDNGVFVDDTYEISIFVLTDEGAAPFIEIIRKFGKEHSRGPGIHVLVAIVPDDNTSSVFAITIWGRFKTYVVVQRKDA